MKRLGYGMSAMAAVAMLVAAEPHLHLAFEDRGDPRPRQMVMSAEIAGKLKAASEKFDKEGPTLSESERGKRQRDLVDQDREFQRKRREFQEDLTQRKNEELSAVVERANKVIKQIYETEKYDLILQEAVFAGPKIDITDKVVKALNAQGAK